MSTRLPSPEANTVAAAAFEIVGRPWRVFVLNWNWKTAVLSAIFRLALWAATMAARGALFTPGSLRGLAVEFVFRIAVGGFWGSLLQVFADARPAWLAAVVSTLLLPGLTHLLEYLALRASGATHMGMAMVTSIAFSGASLLVNWYLMRRGMLRTSRGSASLSDDLRRIFRLLPGFPPAASENSGGPGQ